MSRTNGIEEAYAIRFRVGRKIKTSFVNAKDQKRAERKASAYHNVISVGKAEKDFDRITTRELKTFSEKIVNPTPTAIQLDEFIWMRRNKRIENKAKDKMDS